MALPRRSDPQLEDDVRRQQRAAMMCLLRTGLPQMQKLSDYFTLYIHNRIAEKTRFYVQPLDSIRSGNGKMPPAFQLLLDAEEDRGSLRGMTAVIPSSGNTAADIAVLAPLFHIAGVVAVVDENIPAGKKGQLRLAGAKIVHPSCGESTIICAKRVACEPRHFLVQQYVQHGSLAGHQNFTWPHVIAELGRLQIQPTILTVALGTTSLYVSGAKCLRKIWPEMRCVGAICPSKEDKTPGARSLSELAVTQFGYQEIEGTLISCCKESTYAMAKELYRQFFSGGLTLAMSLVAACTYLNREDVWPLLADQERINVLMVSMDAIASYAEEFVDPPVIHAV
jgi:cysteine synthase